jgi:hypothetical protein
MRTYPKLVLATQFVDLQRIEAVKHLLLLATAILVISGCVIWPVSGDPEPFSDEVTEFIEAGVTEKAEIDERLSGFSRVELRQGSIWVLREEHREMGWGGCLLLPYTYGCESNQGPYESQYLVLEFDDSDRVVEWWRSWRDPVADFSVVIGVERYDLDIGPTDEGGFLLRQNGRIVSTDFICDGEMCMGRVGPAYFSDPGSPEQFQFSRSAELILAIAMQPDGDWTEIYFGEADPIIRSNMISRDRKTFAISVSDLTTLAGSMQ